MAADQWNNLWEIFHAALERPAAERSGFLAQTCRGDEELRGQVESLLASHERAGGFIADSPVSSHATADEQPQLESGRSILSNPPEMIGRYRIRRTIGAGGAGVVFEAEQDVPQRLVALKVLRGGAWLDGHRARLFQREVQSLARLKHPGIAAIYDAGTTADGLQYFAMEFVEGAGLQEIVKTLGDLPARLDLFCLICDAVSHAHQKGVIHRDLKPGNILVTGEPTTASAVGRIKILDFGLAHLTDSDVAVTTILSGSGYISGTLPYMSPEQTRGMPDEIDVRTDVYSLGVILYELLTDQRPYDVIDVAMPEAIRRICHEPPRRPRSADRRVPRDMEVIVLKALEKEPARRYATVDALADDVRRFLARQPVQARPPTAFYQLRKLVERHKVPAALLGVIVVLLSSLAITVVVQAARVSRERDRAIQSARIATEVNAFLNDDLLRSADPRVALGREITVKDALDNAAQRLDGRFMDEPLVEASIRLSIGETYRRLGRFSLAEPHLRRAADLRQSALGPERSETLDALRELAVNYDDWRRYERAQPIFEQVLAGRRRLGNDQRIETLQAIDDLAVSYGRGGHAKEAEPLARAAVNARKQLLGLEHRDTILSLNNLAYVYLQLGRYQEAEQLAGIALSAARRTIGDDDPSITLHTANTLAVVLEKQGRFAESEALHLKTLAARRRVLGDANADTLSSIANLGRLYVTNYHYQEAEPLLLERAKAVANDPTADPEQKKASIAALSDLYRAWGRPEPAVLTEAIAAPQK